MKQIQVTVKGLSPLLMHNEQLVDPRNPFVMAMKPLIAKRTKRTDADTAKIEEYEFLGALYTDENECVCIPSENMEACIRDGARALKKGKEVESGVMVDGASIPLIFSGPKKAKELLKDQAYHFRRSVVVRGNRIMKVRPIFREWALSFTITFDDTVTSAGPIKEFVENAGRLKGLGPWRPRYGRFEITEFKA